MFNRRQPRLIEVKLPQLRQDADLEVVLEVVRRTNIEQARKWRGTANTGRKNQNVGVDQLVWVKKDYTTSLGDRILGVKWVGSYKVKEVLRDGGAYRLENVFDLVRIQKVADKHKPYIGQGRDINLCSHDDGEEEEEVEPRPVRERRPPIRYIEEVDPRQVQTDVVEERVEDSDVEERPVRPRRQRRLVHRYIEDME